ncbi:hypothetical protein [Silvimonas iriomotensis]|uniref:Uncharacterized protein n=1 Tax=Silvimonas iriomotensis TaxID=449662 RepID=A0ABQ2PE66_9NEIS|nr:hypothetical protein [Silvimonas iriomotensis]GGP23848.1 hypothetical protein GCM10010970_38480 [Silvimonas iriomotensis]
MSNYCFQCLNQAGSTVLDCDQTRTLTPVGQGRWVITGNCQSGVEVRREEVMGEDAAVIGYAIG